MKVELIIAISFALLFLPCLVKIYLSSQPKILQMSMLLDIKNIICIEIALLTLLAAYFAIKGYHLQSPTVNLYAKCYSGVQGAELKGTPPKAIRKKSMLSKEEEETIRELTYKAKIIFEY